MRSVPLRRDGWRSRGICACGTGAWSASFSLTIVAAGLEFELHLPLGMRGTQQGQAGAHPAEHAKGLCPEPCSPIRVNLAGGVA